MRGRVLAVRVDAREFAARLRRGSSAPRSRCRAAADCSGARRLTDRRARRVSTASVLRGGPSNICSTVARAAGRMKDGAVANARRQSDTVGRKTSVRFSTAYVPRSGGTSPVPDVDREDRAASRPAAARLAPPSRSTLNDVAVVLDGDGLGRSRSVPRDRRTTARPATPTYQSANATTAARSICRFTGPAAGPGAYAGPPPGVAVTTSARAVVDLREVLHVRERRDLVVRRAGHIDDRRRVDRLVGAERIGVKLHDAERRVGDQDVLVAVLLVRHHVERLVAGAEIGDRDALHLRARLEVAHRDLHERRAGVGGQHVLLAAERVRHERPHGRLRFVAAVRRVPDLQLRALGRRR